MKIDMTFFLFLMWSFITVLKHGCVFSRQCSVSSCRPCSWGDWLWRWGSRKNMSNNKLAAKFRTSVPTSNPMVTGTISSTECHHTLTSTHRTGGRRDPNCTMDAHDGEHQERGGGHRHIKYGGMVINLSLAGSTVAVDGQVFEVTDLKEEFSQTFIYSPSVHPRVYFLIRTDLMTFCIVTCSPMDPLQWMGAVIMRVQTAEKNISIIHKPSINVLCNKRLHVFKKQVKAF